MSLTVRHTKDGAPAATVQVTVYLTATELAHLAADAAGKLTAYDTETDLAADVPITDKALREAVEDAVYAALETSFYRAGDNNAEGLVDEVTARINAKHFTKGA